MRCVKIKLLFNVEEYFVKNEDKKAFIKFVNSHAGNKNAVVDPVLFC